MITKLSDIFKRIETQQNKKKLAVVAAHDPHVLDAVSRAHQDGIIDAILIGDKAKINKIIEDNNYCLNETTIIDEPDNTEAVNHAVNMVREGNADILMKGIIDSATFLRPILRKNGGLGNGEIASSVALFEIKNYHKLLALTDGGLVISPDLKAKTGIIKNAVKLMRNLDIPRPKIAVLGAFELVSESMSATIDAALLSKMASRGQIKNCIVDGPLSFSNVISSKSAMLKGFESEVAGDADVIIAPNIEAANVLYKAFVHLAGARPAAVVMGASIPLVLTSRADSEDIKLNSIKLSASVGPFSD